jgi:hypothetical protein
MLARMFAIFIYGDFPSRNTDTLFSAIAAFTIQPVSFDA